MISTWNSPLRLPMVPKARPMSQVASAQPSSSRSISRAAPRWSGRGRCGAGPASRRGPGHRPGPARARRRRRAGPSSSTTGPIRSSSAATSRWASASRTLPSGRRSGASDTERQPSGCPTEVWRSGRSRPSQGQALPSGRAPPVVAAACPGRAGGKTGSKTRGKTAAGSRSGWPGLCWPCPACSRPRRPWPPAAPTPPPDQRRPRPERRPVAAAGAEDPLDHPRLRPRPRSDRHPRDRHQRLATSTWTAINVHGFMGTTPITTSAELAAAAQVPVDADVGHRITVPGTFASISRLAPGESASFMVRLPQPTLPVSSPGVYWFGVHVLGDDGQGGPRVAVGPRPHVPALRPELRGATGRQEDAALVVPVRSGVVRGPDGTVVDPRLMGAEPPGGASCTTCVATGRAAGGRPLTWLVDPAVLDVVRRLAHGNPARTLSAPGTATRETRRPARRPSASASGSASSRRPVARASPRRRRPPGGRRRAGCASSHALLASDTARGARSAVRRPRRRVRQPPTTGPCCDRPTGGPPTRCARWGLSAGGRSYAPPDGRTTGDALDGSAPQHRVLLADTGVPSGRPHGQPGRPVAESC